MIKLRKINIKGMHNYDDVTYDFKDFTYLFGNNGAGKSTVLEAIQFALLGYIPDYNKTPAGIFSHCNNDTKMSVTLTLDKDGEEVSVIRECTKSGGKGAASVNLVVEPQVDLAGIIADIESPVFNFNEFIGMTANKLKEWFISFLGNNGSELKWESVFTLEEGTDITLQKQMLDYTSGKEVDIASLKDVNEYLKTIQSNKKVDLERIVSTIQNMVHMDDIDTPTVDIESLRNEISQLNAKKSYAIQYEERSRHNALIQAKLSSSDYSKLRDTLDDDDEYYTTIEEQLDAKSAYCDLDSKVTEELDSISKLKGEVSSLSTILNTDGVCPYTKKSCNDIITLKQSYQDKYNELSAEIKIAETELAKDKENRDGLYRMFNQLTSKVDSIKNLYAERDRLKDSILPLMDPPEYTVAGLTERINELTDKVITTETNLKYYGMVDKLTKDKLACDDSLNMLKGWIKSTGANGLQSQITNGAFELLADNMDNYIQALYGDKALKTKFILEEKANSFSFGLVRNDKYIAFDLLSSGEKCIFTLAMLLCLIANAQSELKLVLVDDLLDHLDDNKIKTLFKGLNNIKDIQIILAGVKKYTESNYDDVVTTIS